MPVNAGASPATCTWRMRSDAVRLRRPGGVAGVRCGGQDARLDDVGGFMGVRHGFRSRSDGRFLLVPGKVQPRMGCKTPPRFLRRRENARRGSSGFGTSSLSVDVKRRPDAKSIRSRTRQSGSECFFHSKSCLTRPGRLFRQGQRVRQSPPRIPGRILRFVKPQAPVFRSLRMPGRMKPDEASRNHETGRIALPQIGGRPVQSEQNEKRGDLNELDAQVAGEPAEARIEHSGNV